MLKNWKGVQCSWSAVKKREGVEVERREKKEEREMGITPGHVGQGEAFGFNCRHKGTYW